MRVFLTGATGFIGSRIVPELLAVGHQVVGNTRSDAGARWLATAGASVHRGDLDDPAGLARGAEGADAVIHTAFDHDFARFVENCEKDRRVINAIGDVLMGSDRPFIITSGVALGTPGSGQFACEDVFNRDDPIPRVASELAGEEVGQRGVSVGVVRLPQVHDPVKQGLISPLIDLAREKGMSAYVGDGGNRGAQPPWRTSPGSSSSRFSGTSLAPAGTRWPRRPCPCGRSPRRSAPGWAFPSRP